MKKICFITTSRADFGTLNELIQGIVRKNSFSNKYLSDIKLRHIIKKKFTEILTIELNRENLERLNQEKITILIFKKR